MKSDGVMPTLEAVFNKLGTPLPLGYCNVGRVVEVGRGNFKEDLSGAVLSVKGEVLSGEVLSVKGGGEDKDLRGDVLSVKGDGGRTSDFGSRFAVGDRVVSNGCHAEYVCVPTNLVAKIPDGVSDDEAAFAVIGSIGLQGVRLLNPTFGETVVVVGLGLIGLLTAQFLQASGCRVIGFDFDEQKVQLGREFGIDAINPATGISQVGYVNEQTRSVGCDGVIITASSKSDDIISQSAQMCRKRGRIVLVGVIGLNIRRADFYKKEISFQVSCSYGPGRYDEAYEQRGQDYPVGYVRWTEKRNFEAVLEAIARKSVNVKSLITERVPLDQYLDIYGDMRKGGSIASILEYPEQADSSSMVQLSAMHTESPMQSEDKGIAIIGAGNFTNAVIIPALKGLSADFQYVASAGGLSARDVAQKGGFKKATSDYHEVLKDDAVGLVLITTRHNAHASMVLDAVHAGKHVFVEKPLCLNRGELDAIVEAVERADTDTEHALSVTVGFNRRFAPLAVKLKQLVGDGPKSIVATMNAGAIPADVWVHDMKVGGGRILGEACHYIDLCSFYAGSQVESVCMNALGRDPQDNTDCASILLRYKNGTNAVINYFANGSKAYAKERVEVYSQERTFVIDNWRELRGYGVAGFKKMKTRQDKGHKAQFKLLVERFLQNGAPLIPFDDIINTTKASFAAIESMKMRKWVDV
ncbi:MAG: dehydrogenase [Spartobacteria bacterium]|nr:dehydrogenase [Spartobacteria bacterium]